MAEGDSYVEKDGKLVRVFPAPKAGETDPQKSSSAGTGDDQGWLGDVRHDISHWSDESPIGAYRAAQAQQGGSGIVDVTNKAAEPVVHAVAEAGGLETPTEDPTKKPDDKKKKDDTAATSTAPVDPWTELTDQLVASYAGTINALNPVSSGQDIGAADKAMTASADSMLGASATSPMSQWLNANTQAAQSQGQATTSALAAESAADDTGSAQIAKAMQGLGTAESEQMAAAPYQQLLQSLASEVPYHLSEGYSIPALANAPSWLQAAETSAGVNAGTGGASVPGSTKTLPSPTAVATPASALQTNLDQPTYSFSQGQ